MISWIRVESDAADDPKWSVLGTKLGLSADDLFGKMVRLWGALSKHQADGDLSTVQDDCLEHWAGWKGKPGKFARVYREACVSDGMVKGWMESNGKLAARRAEDRERKTAERLRIVRNVSA